MKIATIVGARPQFVKAAMVTRALCKHANLNEVLIHTGQHYDINMSQVFIDQLALPEPAYNLGIGSGYHGAQTGRMMEALERVLIAEDPNWVLVYGDTNSTLAGALTACKLHIPVAHVEAGLRSFDRRMPEEINRIVTDRVSDLLLVPTRAALENLRREGIDRLGVHLVGDVMFDAALYYSARAMATSTILKQFGLATKQYVLVTLHRAENTDDPQRLRTIVRCLREIAESLTVVFPVHPRTRKALGQKCVEGQLAGRLLLLDPVSYFDMIILEKNARIIATDSGGVQKEAFFYQVPCVTLREETEWVELVELGWNRLAAPASVQAIVSAIWAGISTTPPETVSPYGDGNAAERIAALLNALEPAAQYSRCSVSPATDRREEERQLTP
jgi:UDP-GlcNAc3NAcA epimerase